MVHADAALKSGLLVAQFRAFYGEVLAMAVAAEKGSFDQTSAASVGMAQGDLVARPEDAIGAFGDVPAASSVAPPPPPMPSSAPGGDIPPALAARLAQDQSAAAVPDGAANAGKAEAANTLTGSMAAGIGRATSGDWASVVEQMVQRLTHFLNVGTDQAVRMGGAYGQALYEDAKYAMAALADEIFLHQVSWGGRDAWGQNLVEMRLFGSSLSGERLFQRIEVLLAETSPLHTELASVYLMVLTLGFRGRFRGRDEQALEQYRQRLRNFISHRLAPVRDDTAIFAASYKHTMDEDRESLLPAVARWVWFSLFLVVLYLVVSHGLWVWLTEPVQKIITGGGSP